MKASSKAVHVWFKVNFAIIMMVENAKNKTWLAACLKEIEALLGWEDSSSWSNDDFELLSERIFEKTSIRLSVSTLKRIFGRVRYESFPNNASLNALSMYAGYANWRAFCEAHPEKKQSKLTLLPFLIVIVVSLFGATAWVFRQKRKGIIPPDSAFKFSSRKVTSGLPNSVVFDYDASAAGDSAVMIQQSWDPQLREIVTKQGKQHTSVYYYPGYFEAKLLIGDRIVAEDPVLIMTNGWKGIAERKPIPLYLNDSLIKPKESLSISSEKLKQLLNITDLNDKWMQFARIQAFPGIDAANFNFEISLRNTSTAEESICREVKLLILGTENVINIPLATKGCISNLELFTGDTVINGKDHDLGAFGCDFSQMQLLNCSVINQQLKITLNHHVIDSLPFAHTLGRIIGVRVRFEGAGTVAQAVLSTPGAIALRLIP